MFPEVASSLEPRETGVRPADWPRPNATRPFRVLMVVESSGGGTGHHVIDLCEGLSARGCEVHLIYSKERADGLFLEGLARLRDVRQVVIPMRREIHPADLGALRAVRAYLRRFGPFDAIHGHSSKGGAIARISAIGTGVATFYTPHGLIMMNHSLRPTKRFLYQVIEWTLSRAAAGIIAVSPEEGRAALRYGFGRTRVVVVPNGIGPFATTPRDAARREMGLPDDSLLIGFVGRLVVQKAPEVLVRAFASASATVPEAHLALVGSGPLEQELRRLADALGVGGRVRFLGERPAREVFAAFDVFALPSRNEGLPYVVLEAMAAGLPVVATSTAGVELLLTSDVDGAVVEPDDVEGLAAALTRLAVNPELRAAWGRSARVRVTGFTVEAMVDRTLSVYRERTAGSARPALRPQLSAGLPL